MGRLQYPTSRRGAMGQDDVGREGNQLGRVSTNVVGVASSPANFELHVISNCPAQQRQSLQKCSNPGLKVRIVRSCRHDNPNAPHRRLLRARRERPCGCSATDQRDELAPPHSITSVATASSLSGMLRPSVLAVVRLITRSNFVGCSTGILAGFAPCRILSTKSAARRNKSGKFGP